MVLSHRLEIRQTQTLAMTPQLLQAIRLLQLSHLDLAAHVEAELEKNPLLERSEGDHFAADEPAPASTDTLDSVDTGDAAPSDTLSMRDWSPEQVETRRDSIEADFGTTFENVFQDDTPTPAREERSASDETLIISSQGGAAFGLAGNGEGPDIEATLACRPDLHDHLQAQFDLLTTDPLERLIGQFIIDAVNDAGYLTEPIAAIAERLALPEDRVASVLTRVQGLEPTGVAARDLAECLALQLQERNRFDPAMQMLIDNLQLVVRHDHAALRRLCGVDQDDLDDMLAELRQLDPKPGLAYGSEPTETLVPDVFIRRDANGEWRVELNNDTLPRVLLNRDYHAQLARNARTKAEQSFLSECLQSGDWLTRSLDQRARTILKVATEILRQQEGFFTNGAAFLRPLNLKTVAESIEMHESTISRVTANKAIGTQRGTFPMKYFFSAAVSSAADGEAHAAEAIRHRIRQLVDAEKDPGDVLSDDALVQKLQQEGIEVARRTVAKYRESLRIPSSVERRRAKAQSPAAKAGRRLT